MKIEEAIKKAGKDKIMNLVKDSDVYYLVLTRDNNIFDLDFIDQFVAILDEVQKSKDAVCLVIVGAGKRIFSSGFNLKFWKESPINPFYSVAKISELFVKLKTLGVPTLCVLNGHAVAGGILLALCCDFRWI